MRTNILRILMIIGIGVAAVSCFPEDELTYSGPPLVEIKNHTLGMNSSVLTARGIVTTAGTQTDSTRSVREITRVRDTVYVQLIGRQTASDRTVTFKVRAASTAVHGTHYTFNAANNYDVGTSTGEVIIGANKSIGYILLDLIDAQAAGASVKVEMDLEGSTELAPSPRYDVFKVTIVGQ